MYYKEVLRVRGKLLVFTVLWTLMLGLNFVFGTHYHGAHITEASNVDIGVVVDNGRGPGDNRIPLSLLFALAGVAATIFAGWFGNTLSRENDGHLNIALTLPASRNRYALSIFGVDLGATLAAFSISFLFLLAIFATTGAWPLLYADQDAWQNLGRFLLLPVAFYGIWQAASATMRSCSTGSWMIGLSVIISTILLGLGVVKGLSPGWHALVRGANFLNPMAYATYSTSTTAHIIYPFAAWQLNLIGLAMLGLLGIIIALARWRTVEA